MPKKRASESPYKSGRANAYTVKENTFVVSEPRLKECFGDIYDATLNANPTPAFSWRDAILGTFLSTLITTIYEAVSMEPFIWSGIMWRCICCGILLIASLILWIKRVLTITKSHSDRPKRVQIIDTEFKRIVEISQEESTMERK